MRIKHLLALLLLVTFPARAAVYPAVTNANNTFYGTNTFKKPVLLESGIIGNGAGLTNITTAAATIWDGITTNFTMLTNVRTYIVYGTNQLITFPDATTCTPGVQYRVSSTNGWGNYTLTNKTGTQTIRDGSSLSQKYVGIQSVAYMHNGYGQWVVASRTRVVMPSAQFSCITNIALTTTAIPIPLTTTDFNNSQGIAIGLGTNGTTLSKMWITNSGTYEIAPSIMQGYDGNHTITFWFRTSNTNIPNSATASKGQNGSIRVITVPFVVNVTQTTDFEIWARSDDAAGESFIIQAASGAMPLAPSIIVPIKRISDPFP